MGAAMTSRERIFAALTMSELPDRVPCAPLLMTRGLREGGVACDVAQRDPERAAAAKMTAVRRLGGDVIFAGTDLFTPVENLGAVLDYLPRAQPSLVRHPARTPEAAARLRQRYFDDGFDPGAGRLRTIQREIEILVANGWKEHHAVVTPVGGPLTTAQLVMGSSEFLSLLSEDPGLAGGVIEVALDCVKNVCRMMYEAGVDACNILDPFCSSDILPPEVFREFGLPAQKELFRYLSDELGVPAFTHICTYTQPIWKDVATNGSINFNGDMYPGIDLAKRAIGGTVSLMGSVSPFSTLVHGTPADVAAEVTRLALDVGYNGGFVCMPGCDIDWNVPSENILAMTGACASITYPMDVRALEGRPPVPLPGHPGHPGTRRRSPPAVAPAATAPAGGTGEVLSELVAAVLAYDGERALEWATIGLGRGMSAQELVFDGLSLGMKIVGDEYERNERFVTDMLKASRAMNQAMPVLVPLLEAAAGAPGGPTGPVVAGLVRGNTQDIGKNLVCLMLRASGFPVVDLGKNVRPEEFVAAALEHDAVAVAMSVMTNSSTVYVERTAELVRAQAGPGVFLMFGGAAANVGLARRFEVAYGADANQAVELLRAHLGVGARG